jgi:hypothetical protein
MPQFGASLWSSLMLLESSIMLQENIYGTAVTHEDHYMIII